MAIKKRKCVYPFPTYQATFADGITVRFSVWQPEGKPWDFDHAQRSARLAWAERDLHYRLLFDAAEHGRFNYRPSARDLWYAERREPPAIASAFIEHGGQRFPDTLNNVATKAKRASAKEVKAALSAVLAYLDGKHTDQSAIEAARRLAA